MGRWSAQMLQARGSKSSVSRYVRSPRRCWNLEGPDTTLDTRLSYRDGCSIMSTCSTCRPLQLNRSPDYPMTHNARLCWPLRLYVKSYTRIQACKHNADWGTRAPSCSPLLPDRPHSLPPLCSYCPPCTAFHPPLPPSSLPNGCRYAASRTIVALWVIPDT